MNRFIPQCISVKISFDVFYFQLDKRLLCTKKCKLSMSNYRYEKDYVDKNKIRLNLSFSYKTNIL